ncbi:MAG: hypothetical protein MUF72_10110 [Elainella sp. Prado103]|jgi:hypothetical protein|nr:hypothetical protein [Elainella sp. Prado103]
MPQKLENPYVGNQLDLFTMLGSNKEGASSNLLPNMPGSWVEAKYIKRGKELCGPYLYQRWREGGKLRSRYLGKATDSGSDPPSCE